MKNKATIFLKQLWTVTGEVLKSKTNAAKTKAGAVRTRLIVLSLVSNKKFLFSNISHKFHALLKQEKVDDDEDQAIRTHEIPHKFQALLGHRTKSDVGHLTKPSQKVHAMMIGTNEKENEENSTEESKDKVVEHSNYLVIPPVREEYRDGLVAAQCRGKEDDDDDYPDLTHCLFDSEDLGDLALSAVDVVKQSKPPEDEFVLEDEIDRVADLFIKRFRRQMKMQNEESFMVYQGMLDRSA